MYENGKVQIQTTDTNVFLIPFMLSLSVNKVFNKKLNTLLILKVRDCAETHFWPVKPV